ncbi:MAG: glutathione peroxidase [Janthinobacterium lividum]
MLTNLGTIPFVRPDGTEARLADFSNRVVLVVNVASKCGLTPQYASLEAMYRAHRDGGFSVLGFPCNQFRGQEPGSDAEIQEFCRTSYDVSFPVFAKIEVNGSGRHPLYAALVAACPDATEKLEGGMRETLARHGLAPAVPEDVLWNFEKFLIGRDGIVLDRFAPDIAADDPVLQDAMRRALAAGYAG